MQEDLLHYVWKFRAFSTNRLYTSEGEEINIIRPGEHNTDAGPDFLNAQVSIGDKQWAGHVEIHLQSSDWHAHGHSTDPAYQNVILHVVYEKDTEKNVPTGVPLFILKDCISPSILEHYESLSSSRDWIPCISFLPRVDDFKRNAWLERVLIDRLEEKTAMISRILEECDYDWSEAAYRLLGQCFGFKINSEGFAKLTRSIPLKTLQKHRNSLFQLEALLLGQAGFLQEIPSDEYTANLQKEYQFLQRKYQLTPLVKSDWKLLRLHPANFPPVRISQFSSLLYKTEHLFSSLTEFTSAAELLQLFDVSASAYWETHYLPGRKTTGIINHRLGKESRQNLMMNGVAVLLFSYGNIKCTPALKDKAIDLLEQLPAENNSLIRGWKAAGLRASSAFGSQALIQLKRKYCDAHRCLHCGIGTAILKEEG